MLKQTVKRNEDSGELIDVIPGWLSIGKIIIFLLLFTTLLMSYLIKTPMAITLSGSIQLNQFQVVREDDSLAHAHPGAGFPADTSLIIYGQTLKGELVRVIPHNHSSVLLKVRVPGSLLKKFKQGTSVEIISGGAGQPRTRATGLILACQIENKEDVVNVEISTGPRIISSPFLLTNGQLVSMAPVKIIYENKRIIQYLSENLMKF